MAIKDMRDLEVKLLLPEKFENKQEGRKPHHFV